MHFYFTIRFYEKSSSYFFDRLKTRAKKTHIDKLHVTNSNHIQEVTNNPQKILKSIHTFYADLYNLHPEEIERTPKLPFSITSIKP